MATDYCSPNDLHPFGVPRGALTNPGRLVAQVSAASNTIELDDHGAADGDPVTFRAEAGGTLPAPLEEGRTYYARPITDSTFTVAATLGGDAIDLTTAGERIVAVFNLPKDSAIRWASRLIDDMIPSIAPLVDPIPEIVRMTAAELAAARLGYFAGAPSTVTAIADASKKRLDRWAAGASVRGNDGAPSPAPANTAVSLISPRDGRGWGRYGGIA